MARFTIRAIFSSTKPKTWEYPPIMLTSPDWIGDPKYWDGSFSVFDVHVREIIFQVFTIHDQVFTIHDMSPLACMSYMLETGEEEKFGTLPDGWCFTYLNGFPTLTIDLHYLQKMATEALIDNSITPTPENVMSLVNSYWTHASSGFITERISLAFDIDNKHDKAVRFSLGSHSDRIKHIRLFSSKQPWVGSRQIEYAYRHVNQDVLNEFGMVTAIFTYWFSNADQYLNVPQMDDYLVSKPIALARKALGLKEIAEARERHVYRGRQIVLDHDERVPFPRTCYTEQFGREVLVLATTKDGRYKVPEANGMFMDDAVIIHRIGDQHRFIFWDYVFWDFRLAWGSYMVFLMPMIVRDSECARKAPLSPMRGMDPRVTRAVIGNPYFSSALQHAFNRRKYLRSQLDMDGNQPHWDTKGLPVLIRAGMRSPNAVRGSRISNIGRKAARDGSYLASRTVRNMLRELGKNELLFDNPVQPVAEMNGRVIKRKRAIHWELTNDLEL